MVNLHNTETNEYLETLADEPRVRAVMDHFFDELVRMTTFDPASPLRSGGPSDHTASSLYRERKIAVMLMEQRIGTSKKLGRRLTVEDRLAFGRELIRVMGQTVQPRTSPARDSAASQR
jgi:hypothetical protein